MTLNDTANSLMYTLMMGSLLVVYVGLDIYIPESMCK